MLNLNFDLYSGHTLLHDWWKQIKSHFTQVQDAHNALENELTESITQETESRISACNDLSSAITTERSERISADAVLQRSQTARVAELEGEIQSAVSDLEEKISNQKTTLESSINSEADARAGADAALEAKIGAEKTERESADDGIKTRVSALETNAHTHNNKSTLDFISMNDIDAWYENISDTSANSSKIKKLNETCDTINIWIMNLYSMFGVTEFYDGGVNGESQNDTAVDGGEFGIEPENEMDCGPFNFVYSVSEENDEAE